MLFFTYIHIACEIGQRKTELKATHQSWCSAVGNMPHDDIVKSLQQLKINQSYPAVCSELVHSLRKHQLATINVQQSLQTLHTHRSCQV